MPPPETPADIPPDTVLVPGQPGMTAGRMIDQGDAVGGVLARYAAGARGFAGRSGGALIDLMDDIDPGRMLTTGLGMFGAGGATLMAGAAAPSVVMLGGVAGGLYGNLGREFMRRRRSGPSGGNVPQFEPTEPHMRGFPHASMMSRIGPIEDVRLSTPRIDRAPTVQLTPEQNELYIQVYSFYIGQNLSLIHI